MVNLSFLENKKLVYVKLFSKAVLPQINITKSPLELILLPSLKICHFKEISQEIFQQLIQNG